jgi:hypothetical protein
MTLGIMQQQQCATSFDRPGAPDKTTWDQVVAVNRLAMSINVDREWRLRFWNGGLPQGGREACEGIGERFDSTRRGYLGKEPLYMAVPIRSRMFCQQSQSIAGITA